MAAVACKHDSARVLQTLAKYGSSAQRVRLTKEICAVDPAAKKDKAAGAAPTVIDIAINHYGHWVLLKLLQYGGEAARTALCARFRGSYRKMAAQADAAKVVDLIYANGTKQERSQIRQELYGAEFALFDDGNADKDAEAEVTMAGLIERHPTKKASITRTAHELLERYVRKEMLGFRSVPRRRRCDGIPRHQTLTLPSTATFTTWCLST